jgi:hypothetical protein
VIDAKKKLGASGPISLGKRLAGPLFEVIFHADGRFEMLPMRAVAAALTSAKAVGNYGEKACRTAQVRGRAACG